MEERNLFAAPRSGMGSEADTVGSASPPRAVMWFDAFCWLAAASCGPLSLDAFLGLIAFRGRSEPSGIAVAAFTFFGPGLAYLVGPCLPRKPWC